MCHGGAEEKEEAELKQTRGFGILCVFKIFTGKIDREKQRPQKGPLSAATSRHWSKPLRATNSRSSERDEEIARRKEIVFWEPMHHRMF